MRSGLSVALVLLLFGASFDDAHAATIFQSGTLGAKGVTKDEVLSQRVLASNVYSFNFVGARFEVLNRVRTTRIGGHFVGGFEHDTFFGAIIRLTDDADLPDSHDLSTPDVLGVTSLTFPHPSDEVFGELALDLAPGTYAVVFGSGLFDTTGRGGAVRNGEDIGMPSYINWQSSNGWFDNADMGFVLPGNRRFVVEGHFVPEPTILKLAVVAASLIAPRYRRRRILSIQVEP